MFILNVKMFPHGMFAKYHGNIFRNTKILGIVVMKN